MYEIKLSTGETVEALNRQMEETENQASILTFTLLVNSPHFNSFEEFITKIEVYHNEYKIFDGRVINLKPNMDSKGIFSCDVTCESSLNYLNDTRVGKWEIHPGEYTLTETVATLDPSIIYTNVTVNVFLELILNNHNAKVSQDKKILLGNITIEDTVYCYTDRETSLNIIQEKLVKSKGGYIQIREVDGNKYLDYLVEPPIITLNIIELAVNMVNINRQGLWKGVYTRLIPFGKDGLNIKDINNGIEYIEDTELAARYGIVEIVENFSDITVAENLLIKARKRLTELNQELYAIECNSLDLSSIDNNFDEFQISQYCRLKNNILGLNELNRIICKTIDFDEEQNIKLKFSNELPAATMRATKNEQRLVTNEATTKRTQESLNSTNKTIKTIKDDIANIKTDIVTVKDDVAIDKQDIATLKTEMTTKVNLSTVESKIAIAKGEANSYTDEQVIIVSNKIASVYKYIGSVVNYEDLPSTGNKVGDVWNVGTTLDGINYAWSVNGWDALGLGIDLSPYYTGSQSDNKYVAKEIGKALMLDVDKAKLAGIESNAEVNNISDINSTNLTNNADTTLHYHTSDRDRANHLGTQLSSTISDFLNTVRATVLTGLTTTTNAVISATDTILGALGKLQKQVSDNLTTLTSHTSNSTIHLTSTERTNWNSASTNNHTHSNKTTLDNTTASYTTAEQTKLSGISTGANNYTLPVASAVIGGVKSGTDITIDASGNVSVNDDSHNHIIANVDGLQTALDGKVDDSQVLTNVPAGAKFTDTVYVHPTNHPPSIITQDSSNRFVTDAEKATWNGKATQATIDASINGIQIGGSNLLSGTKDMIGVAYKTAETFNGFAVATGTPPAASYADTYSKTTPILDGLEYTVSFYAKSTLESQNMSCYFYTPNTTVSGKSSTGGTSTAADGGTIVSVTNVWKRYWVTWKQSVGGSSKSLKLGRVHSPGGGVSISAVKLEKGNKATDWSPAIEDIDSAIALKVDKSTGKSLLSDTEITRLSGISTGANKVLDSTINGNILIDGVETNIYTHPTGTNPHGTTKTDVGLGSVNNTSDIAKNVLSATKLTTSRTIALTGDVTGSIAFDGSGNVNITSTVVDDLHNHVISNVDGLQTALGNKADKTANGATRPTTNLFVGMVFFDTLLGKPIWCKTISPVAWVDSTGRNADATPGLYIN